MRLRFRCHKPIGFLLLAPFFLLSCKVEPPKPEFTPPEGSYGLIYTHILSVSCGVPACHDGNTYHPRLSGQNTYSSLVTKHVHNDQALNAGLHLVKPFDPDSSFLYQKITFDSSEFQFGSPMPQGGLKLTANQIRFLRQWIAAGAPETGHVADRSLIE